MLAKPSVQRERQNSLANIATSDTAVTRDYGAFFAFLDETQQCDLVTWMAYEKLGSNRKTPTMSHTAKEIAPWLNFQAKVAMRKVLMATPEYEAATDAADLDVPLPKTPKR